MSSNSTEILQQLTLRLKKNVGGSNYDDERNENGNNSSSSSSIGIKCLHCLYLKNYMSSYDGCIDQEGCLDMATGGLNTPFLRALKGNKTIETVHIHEKFWNYAASNKQYLTIDQLVLLFQSIFELPKLSTIIMDGLQNLCHKNNNIRNNGNDNDKDEDAFHENNALLYTRCLLFCKVLAANRSIQEVELRIPGMDWNVFTENMFVNNRKNQTIVKLDLANNNMNNADCILLSKGLSVPSSSSYGLKILILRNNQIGTKGFQALCDEILSFSLQWITSTTMLSLSNSSNNNTASSHRISASNKTSRLQTLDLSHNYIGNTKNCNDYCSYHNKSNNNKEQQQYLHSSHCYQKINTSLINLDLSYNRITSKCCKLIFCCCGCPCCVSISNFVSLEYLKLNHNHIGNKGCEYIGNTIHQQQQSISLMQTIQSQQENKNDTKNNKNIRKINTTMVGLKSLLLSKNKISDDGCRRLCSAILRNQSDNSNNMNTASLFWSSAQIIMPSIIQLSICLQKLDLSHNSISNDGCKALASLIHPVVERRRQCGEDFKTREYNMLLSSCSNPTTTAAAVAYTIIEKKLTNLNLSSNRIQDEGILYLARAIHNNKTLTSLLLTDNPKMKVDGCGLASLAMTLRDANMALESIGLVYWGGSSINNSSSQNRNNNNDKKKNNKKNIFEEIEYYLKLNRAGRKYLLDRCCRQQVKDDDISTHKCYNHTGIELWMQTLIKIRYDAQCLYYFLSCYPEYICNNYSPI